MLTSDDLRKIGEVIDQRLDIKLEEKLESKLEEKLESIKKDIRILKNSQRKLRKDMKLVIGFLDRERFS